jgi:hypothetical protein
MKEYDGKTKRDALVPQNAVRPEKRTMPGVIFDAIRYVNTCIFFACYLQHPPQMREQASPPLLMCVDWV